jgi:hypothetical protein
MVATAVGLVLISFVLVLTIYGQRSFQVMSNYSDLDAKSRQAIMLLSKEIRQATHVTQARTNSSGKLLTLTNTVEHSGFNLAWDAGARTVTIEQMPGITNVLLTGCDEWNYTLYNDAPRIIGGKVVFSQSTSPAACKLIEMSWTCSRTIAGKSSLPSVESVSFALRNSMQ